MITEELKQLYQTHTGSPATDITELSSSGSNRRYFRLSGSVSLIGVSGTSIEENNAFIYMAAHFREKRLPVPQVYCWSVDKSFYLQEEDVYKRQGQTDRCDGRGNRSGPHHTFGRRRHGPPLCRQMDGYLFDSRRRTDHYCGTDNHNHWCLDVYKRQA